MPTSKKAVDCKWLYRLKLGSGASDKIYKARLVAKGFTQIPGVDFDEVFSPVAKYTTICLLCALVAIFDLELDQMDVITAFLYGSLDEEIYMKQPLGFVWKGQEDLVCLLQRSFYGLKQSSRQWNKRFDDFMLAQGFKRSIFDPCVYLKKANNSIFSYVLLVLYVDDMLIAAKDRSDIIDLKSKLSSEFSMKDLGSSQRILGMAIHRD